MIAIPAIAVVMIVVSLMTFATVSIFEPAFAQEEKDPGASGLAPDENPQDPSFDPELAPDDAPGQIGSKPCPACAKDSAPGQEGLKQGIIGPM
jgi:hypothetical protein